jgi:glucose/arabinose dehydrogenase
VTKSAGLLPPILILTLALACVGPAAPPASAPSPTPVSGACGSEDDEEAAAQPDCATDSASRHPPGGLPQLLPTPAPAGTAGGPLRVETVAEGLSMPLSPVWTPDGRKMFFSEVKSGAIRVMLDGTLQPQPFARLPIAKGAETGLLGLVLDPDYARNRYLYAYHSDPETDRNRVLRFEDRDGQASAPVEIVKSVAVSDRGGAHNGGRLGFGPDGLLYVTTGNGQSSRVGQDPCKLGGKILRVQGDGSPPSDSPHACAPTYAQGFRNPFGLAFHPLTGALFVSENGGRGHDEINLVQREGNYGHPLVEGIANDPRFVDPIWESGPVSIGPTGLAFYTGDRLPEYRNDLFFCGVHTGQLSRLRLTGPDFERVEAMEVEVLREQVDCRLDVANGPDGALYFTNFSTIARITR